MTWVEKFGGAGADMIGPAGQQQVSGVAATFPHYMAIRGPGALMVQDCSENGCINTKLHIPGSIALKQNCSGCVSRRKVSARAESRQRAKFCCFMPCIHLMSPLTGNASRVFEGNDLSVYKGGFSPSILTLASTLGCCCLSCPQALTRTEAPVGMMIADCGLDLRGVCCGQI